MWNDPCALNSESIHVPQAIMDESPQSVGKVIKLYSLLSKCCKMDEYQIRLPLPGFSKMDISAFLPRVSITG